MASQRYILLAVILITTCLDESFIITAATVVWNPKTTRYIGSYNLDKGPVFYEAYPTRDSYQKKRFFDQNTIFETSFQLPLDRLAYSVEADHPVSINESFVVDGNMETSSREQRQAIERNYHVANQLASFPNKRLTIFDDDKNSRVVNVEEISKFVRKAIFRDLKNWNALEEYLNRIVHQDQHQLEMHSGEIHKNEKDGTYIFLVNHTPKDSKQLSVKASLLRKLDVRDAKPLRHFEGVDVNGSTTTSEMNVSEMTAQTVDISSIDVVSNSLLPENIFQPRPQLIRYMFFKRLMPPQLDKGNEKVIDVSTPRRSYSNNLIHEKITDGDRVDGRRGKETVKVTSIKISKLPRHKTRHHHGEWPKRDYSSHFS